MCVRYKLYCIHCNEICGDDFDFPNMSCTQNKIECTWRKVWIHPALKKCEKCENCKFCKDNDDCVYKIESKRPPQYILYDVKMTETFRFDTSQFK